MELNTTHDSVSWSYSDIQNFWGKVACQDHLVQIYENDKILMNTLEGFVGDGFLRNESAIIIATRDHLLELDERLLVHEFDVHRLKSTHRFITVPLEEALDAIMVNNWPDEDKFHSFVAGLINRTGQDVKKIRVFGEIVAALWKDGHSEATIYLENLWHKLQLELKFCLFCAYPKNGFTQDDDASIKRILNTHSKVIDGNSRPSTEIYYNSVNISL